MPVRFDVIGTGLTKRVQPTLILSSSQESDGRIILNVGEPCSEEDVAALTAYMENIAQTSTFEGIVAPWEVFCQDVLAKAKLPPWDKYVRIYANGDWADDLPEDWYPRWQEIRGPWEGAGRASYIAELRYGIDSQEWFAAKILQDIDLVRKLIARGETASVAHLALDLGMWMATAEFKFTWELDALLGKDTRKKRQDANRRSAQERGKIMQEQRNKVRKAADEIWERHPSRTNADVIRNIKKQEQFKDMYVNTLRGYLSKPEEWSTAFKPRKQKT